MGRWLAVGYLKAGASIALQAFIILVLAVIDLNFYVRTLKWLELIEPSVYSNGKYLNYI